MYNIFMKQIYIYKDILFLTEFGYTRTRFWPKRLFPICVLQDQRRYG